MISHLVLVHHLYLPAVAHRNPFSFMFSARRATCRYFNPGICVVFVAMMLSLILASIAQHDAITLPTFIAHLASSHAPTPVCRFARCAAPDFTITCGLLTSPQNKIVFHKLQRNSASPCPLSPQHLIFSHPFAIHPKYHLHSPIVFPCLAICTTITHPLPHCRTYPPSLPSAQSPIRHEAIVCAARPYTICNATPHDLLQQPPTAPVPQHVQPLALLPIPALRHDYPATASWPSWSPSTTSPASWLTLSPFLLRAS